MHNSPRVEEAPSRAAPNERMFVCQKAAPSQLETRALRWWQSEDCNEIMRS